MSGTKRKDPELPDVCPVLEFPEGDQLPEPLEDETLNYWQGEQRYADELPERDFYEGDSPDY